MLVSKLGATCMQCFVSAKKQQQQQRNSFRSLLRAVVMYVDYYMI